MADDRARRIAVVLFNLGGPDRPEDVRGFLENLFKDPAILSLPNPFRRALAWFIAKRRAPSAQENYAKMGGGSPLLANTQAQAKALEAALADGASGDEFRCFIAMRYWSPFVEQAAAQVRDWAPDEIVLLPLYPQFSTTTTGSSLSAWHEVASDLPVRTVCCYPNEPSFIEAHARAVTNTWDEAGRPERVRVLFSAHGLPERVIEAGDPYQAQVETTCAAVAASLPDGLSDWAVCYQSRVGPLKWIGPSTEEAIAAAGEAGMGALVTPIAFVSEHIETLVELDDEYGLLARELGVAPYLRAPALGDDPKFIECLARLTRSALEGPMGVKPPSGAPICPANCSKCPAAEAAA